MDNISQNEKLSTIVKALDSKRAEDIRVIEIGDLTIVADYFVIANGTSSVETGIVLPFSTESFIENFKASNIAFSKLCSAYFLIFFTSL